MSDDKMVWVIHTYARINIYRKDHERLVQIHQKYTTNDSMECIYHNRCLISGQDQSDDQPEYRLELS